MNNAIYLKFWSVLCLGFVLLTTQAFAQEHTVGRQGSHTSAIEVQVNTVKSLIKKIEEKITTLSNCYTSSEFWDGAGCQDAYEEDPNVRDHGRESTLNCTATNEVAQWNATSKRWYCKPITVPVDCSAPATLSECSTAVLNLTDGETVTNVSCSGNYGTCTANATCSNGIITVDSEFCPTTPVGCYDSIGTAGCASTQSLSHTETKTWTCDTGYSGFCEATCNNGSLQAASNNCAGTGTWVAGSWSTCSTTCGGGTQTRSYTCQGGACTTPQPANDSQSCNTQACGPDCDSQSITVSRNTTDGRQTCMFVAGSGMNGDTIASTDTGICDWTSAGDASCSGNLKCVGNTWQVESWNAVCGLSKGSWTTGAWSTCDATCGGGTQTRSVTCGFDTCTGTKPATSQTCNTQACATSGAWTTGSWGAWSACSKTCGGGTQTRSRSVTCAYTTCTGTKPASTQSQACNTQACATSGAWTTGAWSACSKTCGGGTQTRSVTCNFTSCTGTKPATNQTCNTQACAPTGCLVRHPIGWGGYNRGKYIPCNEYYMAPGGTARESYIPPGVTIKYNATFCPSKNCNGYIQLKCPSSGGSFTVVNEVCKSGPSQIE
tara:strand:- start:285392 stop:287203 length:1812 start_codon:yes stop_codon:yes gene_type:complete